MHGKILIEFPGSGAKRRDFEHGIRHFDVAQGFRRAPAYPHRMDGIEIWRTAGDLVATHGAEGAVFQAAARVDRHKSEGDAVAARDWLLVLDAVEEIVRPVGRDRLN